MRGDQRRLRPMPPCIRGLRGSNGRTARYPSGPMAQERITVDPNWMRGLSCIRDTRVTVSAVLGQLAAGAGIVDVLIDFPG
jgi:Protein of unknown function (DUF433)